MTCPLIHSSSPSSQNTARLRDPSISTPISTNRPRLRDSLRKMWRLFLFRSPLLSNEDPSLIGMQSQEFRVCPPPSPQTSLAAHTPSSGQRRCHMTQLSLISGLGNYRHFYSSSSSVSRRRGFQLGPAGSSGRPTPTAKARLSSTARSHQGEELLQRTQTSQRVGSGVPHRQAITQKQNNPLHPHRDMRKMQESRQMYADSRQYVNAQAGREGLHHSRAVKHTESGRRFIICSEAAGWLAGNSRGTAPPPAYHLSLTTKPPSHQSP